MEIIKCESISKKFKVGDEEASILSNISLSINKGDFVSIIGESGSGKSTLLNILGGLMSSDTGSVIINDKNITNYNENQLALFRRDNLGFVFQSYNLINQLTALENVEMPLIFAGVPEKERIKRAKEMLDRVGLTHRLNHKPSELSGGQQQRVSIARALINNPSVVLADEPTGNLDSKTSTEILELLKEINTKYKTTFIVVTHSNNVNMYSDKVINMRDGLIYNEEKKENE